MSLPVMRLPGIPSPPFTPPRRYEARLLLRYVCSPVQRAWRVTFLDNPGRTHPLGAYGSSPAALVMPPIPLPAKQCRCCWRWRLLDFHATDLIFGVSEMGPRPGCARACSHLVMIA